MQGKGNGGKRKGPLAPLDPPGLVSSSSDPGGGCGGGEEGPKHLDP